MNYLFINHITFYAIGNNIKKSTIKKYFHMAIIYQNKMDNFKIIKQHAKY